MLQINTKELKRRIQTNVHHFKTVLDMNPYYDLSKVEGVLFDIYCIVEQTPTARIEKHLDFFLNMPEQLVTLLSKYSHSNFKDEDEIEKVYQKLFVLKNKIVFC